MERPKAKAPARRYHMSGRSVVTISRRDFYLGPHDSPEAIARYAALVTFYQQHGLSLPEGFELANLDPLVAMMLGQSPMTETNQADLPILVRHVTGLYREHAKVKYANAHRERDWHTRLSEPIVLVVWCIVSVTGEVPVRQNHALGHGRRFPPTANSCGR